jgi:hypothetical protein
MGISYDPQDRRARSTDRFLRHELILNVDNLRRCAVLLNIYAGKCWRKKWSPNSALQGRLEHGEVCVVRKLHRGRFGGWRAQARQKGSSTWCFTSLTDAVSWIVRVPRRRRVEGAQLAGGKPAACVLRLVGHCMRRTEPSVRVRRPRIPPRGCVCGVEVRDEAQPSCDGQKHRT